MVSQPDLSNERDVGCGKVVRRHDKEAKIDDRESLHVDLTGGKKIIQALPKDHSSRDIAAPGGVLWDGSK